MEILCLSCVSKIIIPTIIAFVVYLIVRLICCSSKRPNLSGKHVLVTGGSSGIGKCVAIEAAKIGADVTIIARDPNKLQAATDEIKTYAIKDSQRINYLSLDISRDYPFIQKCLHQLEAEFGPVYILFSCAGTAICGTVDQLSIEDANYLINLNFLGTLHVVKALIPSFKSRKEGFIAITASQAALLGIYGYSTYCCTKFALRGLAECLHMELKPYNISVTLVLPPDTDTPGFENEEKSKPEATKEISQKGGLFKPETIAVKIVKDVLDKKFFCTVGFDGALLTVLCSGMSPASSVPRLLYESCFMGVLRLVSHYIHYDMAKIVAKHEKVAEH